MKQTFRVSSIIISLFLLTTLILSAQEKESTYKALIYEDGVQRADIIVDSYFFKPDHIIVLKGIPVEFKLRSVTSIIPHNFSMDYPEAGLEVDEDISHGEDVTIAFIPIETGNYEFYCDKTALFGLVDHREKGMEGVLEVREE